MIEANSVKRLATLGFAAQEIESLRRRRAAYIEQLQIEQRRLEFVRWLVATGRLTDGEPQTSLFENENK